MNSGWLYEHEWILGAKGIIPELVHALGGKPWSSP